MAAGGDGDAAVRVDRLSYAYPDGDAVLRDVSFTVEAGETVVIAGLSGCGKTTLSRCLTGLAPKALGGTCEGTVEIMGQDIAPLPLSRIALGVGLVFQDPDDQMITTTVEDELAFALENLGRDPREIRERVDHELERLGLAPFALRSPTRLSGGEKHLVAIASVLALDPPIIVLDEPLTHLDEKGCSLVRDVMLDLRSEGRTLIVVEHDLSRTDFADRYLVLDDGRLVSSSSTPPPDFMDCDPDPWPSAGAMP